MGYCDLNFIVELKLKNGTPYLAEVQVNHDAMLEAKSEAHTYYTRWCASGCPSCARAAPRRPCTEGRRKKSPCRFGDVYSNCSGLTLPTPNTLPATNRAS